MVEEVAFPEEWYELGSADHFWFQWRLGAAMRQIRDVGLTTSQRLKVLEVGCGTGVLRDQFEARTAWSIDITDLNLSALRSAQRGRGRTLYYNILDRLSQLEKAYDVVIAYDVIEHLDRPQEFLDAAVWHLREGGWLMLNVPALSFLYSVYDEAAGHVRRYREGTLRKEASHRRGLSVEDLRYWGLCLVPLLAARKILLSRRESGPDILRAGFRPPHRLANIALQALMKAETSLMRRPPIGATCSWLA